MLWRFKEQDACWPAMALSSHLRIPTGDDSAGVDLEMRLVMTNEYESGIRSHLNVFGKSVNGNNDDFDFDDEDGSWLWGDDDDFDFEDARDFQWGVVLGLDGPLCNDGSVRWVADYMHRSSYFEGSGNINMLELGWEWNMAAGHNLGMSFQVGLDGSGDTPNFGAAIAYSLALVQ
jgi:hypothetical protein